MKIWCGVSLFIHASVSQFSKTPEGNWLFSESEAEDGVLTLVSANCQIPYQQIYDRVKFDIDEQSTS